MSGGNAGDRVLRAEAGGDRLHPDHYDDLEMRDPAQRERALLAALPRLIASAKQQAPGYAAILADVEPGDVISREALAKVPVIRKSELKSLQARLPPLGGLNTVPLDQFAKIFISPGPLYEVEGFGADWWRTARALYAAGFRRGDRVTNTFAYHMTPAGAIFESGALACGCVVLPAGVGQTEMQASAIMNLRIDGFIGTPSFLKLIVDKADDLRADLSSLRKAMVAAEYLRPDLRRSLTDRGIAVMQSYATADVGLIAYESRDAGGALCDGMVLDEGVLLELVHPGTGVPVSDGEIGEVVVTRFDAQYPLIRFALGDLSAALQGSSPCGRTNTRIKGWLGRADQSVKVRGMFVHPSHVGEIVARHGEIIRARLVVDIVEGRDAMTLWCEVKSDPGGLAQAVADTARAITKMRVEVALREPGSLPADGRVIEDARS